MQVDTGKHLMSPIFCMTVVDVFGGGGDGDPDGGYVEDEDGRMYDGV